MDQYKIVVIGAGAAGLVVAIGCAKAGKKVLLIEKGNFGGDCTNYGCIPSKSLIASGKTAYMAQEAIKMGIQPEGVEISGERALERVRHIVSHMRSTEDAEALAKHGVKTIEGTAQFVSPHHLKVKKANGETVEVFAEQTVLATGSSPLIPTIKGLDHTRFQTNETIFSLKKVPKSLIVVGGGPIGCELAHAFARLGAKVSLSHKRGTILNRESPDASKVILEQFKKEGLDLHLGFTPISVEEKKGMIHLEIQQGESGEKRTLIAEELLISVGRKPHLKELNLDAAGVNHEESGIQTDCYGRTNKRHIWAVGDCTGAPFFTHYAEYQARGVLTSLILPMGMKKKIKPPQQIPRVTFTDPEVASVGLSEKQALEKYPAYKLKTYRVNFSDVDRAITAGRTEGFVEIVTKKWSSKILGATIVSPRAGEMLMQISTAMYFDIPLRKLAKVIFPYPIYSHAIRKAADKWLTETLLPFGKKSE